jgi:hypothetical protein
MSVKLTPCPKNIPTSSFARPSKIYPSWDFWLENKQSGNPATLPRSHGPKGQVFKGGLGKNVDPWQKKPRLGSARNHV